jgi:hypothetical protein
MQRDPAPVKITQVAAAESESVSESVEEPVSVFLAFQILR